jgi:hypothetical protein
MNLVKLKEFSVDFDCNGMTPFFQVHQDNRVRFDIDALNMANLKLIINDIFNKDKQINAIVVSEYIVNNKRKSAKTRIGQVIHLKNWKEHVVLEEGTSDGIVYSTIGSLNPTDVYNYCLSVKKGLTRAYIAFHSNEYLLYVSSDVIDIISSNATNISKLKDRYNDFYDRYYEGNAHIYG